MAQTLDQLRIDLSTPDYGVAYIINNNPEEVADRLRAQGFIVSDADGMADALNELLAAGNTSGFRQALSVPVRLDRISPEEIAVLTETAVAMANAGGEPITKNSDGGFNVAALFGGLATGYLSYLTLTGQQQVNPQAPNTNQQPQQPRQDNTMAWVLGIAAIVVVVVVVVMLTKGKK